MENQRFLGTHIALFGQEKITQFRKILPSEQKQLRLNIKIFFGLQKFSLAIVSATVQLKKIKRNKSFTSNLRNIEIFP